MSTTKELTKIFSLSQDWVNLISERRSYIMGIATIMIVLFHASSKQTLGPFHYGIHSFFWLGVEIFLFLSGFGMHYALSKTPQPALASFYKKRVLRLMPTCIIFGIVLLPLWYYGAPYLYQKFSISFFLAFIGLDVWYIRTQLIFYLLTPFFHALLTYKKQATVIVLFATSVCLLLSSKASPFYLNFSEFVSASTIVWSINRLPAFLIGFYTAMHLKGTWQRKNAYAYTLLSLLVAGVYCTARLVITYCPHLLNSASTETFIQLCASNDILFFTWPCFCMLIAQSQNIMPTKMVKSIEWMGKHSLEIFLTHAAIFPFCRTMCYFNFPRFLLATAASIILAVLLKRVVDYIVRWLGFHNA